MSKQRRTLKMIRELRRLGYRMEMTASQQAMSPRRISDSTLAGLAITRSISVHLRTQI
jgi:hypothetical protein